jgi:hypothetical protein
MAVKVTVYGTANMAQIDRARASLDQLEAKARASASGFRGSMTRLSNAAASAGASMQKSGQGMTRNLTLPIAALGAGLYKATQNAAEDAKAQVILAGALRNNAGATDAVVKSTEDWITKQGELLGISDDNLRPALRTLVGATKDVTKAQTLAGVAMDISAAYGVPLETASKAIAKAYTGQTSQLTKLVPGIDAATVKSKDFGKIMQNVAGIVGGQASAAADTQAGKIQRAKVAFDEASESLGNSFMPILTDVTNIITKYVVPAIKSVADYFKGMDTQTKRNVLGFLAVVAVLGPVTMILGKLVTGISAVANASIFMANTTMKAVGGLQNLVTGLINANAGSSAFATPMMRLGGAIRTASIATWNWVTALGASIVAGLKQAGTWVAQTASLIAHKVASAAAVIATNVMTAAQWALNVALNANPIGLVVLALAAIAAAFYFAYENSDAFAKSVNEAWTAIANSASAIYDGVTKWINQTFGWLGDQVRTFLNLGKNIADGLARGLAEVGPEIYKRITTPIMDAVDWVKDALGIRSPSTVTTEIGENFGQGFVNGITNKTADAKNAATNVANAATTALNDGLFNVDRNTAVTKLSEAGVLAASEVFNFNLKDVTDAAMGSDAQYDKLLTSAEKQRAKAKKMFGSSISPMFETFIQGLKATRSELMMEGSENDRIAEALGNMVGTGATTITKQAEKLKLATTKTAEVMASWSLADVVKTQTMSITQALDAMMSQITAKAEFLNNLTKLGKLGLNTTVLKQITDMGADGGGSIAAALASGTKEQIAQYNTSYSENQRISTIIGNVQAGVGPARAVTISPGAVTVTIQGSANQADVSTAINDALKDLVTELRSN